ncbi:MAG TPA: hypothetical protein VNA88_16245 [Candidatus Kapabacteria bacterium]|jgi:hypothetical protein|nr:hypothetical protein [Candidatus Kapabacteria bacterium]
MSNSAESTGAYGALLIEPTIELSVAGAYPQVAEVRHSTTQALLGGGGFVRVGGGETASGSLKVILNRRAKRTDVLSWDYRLRNGLVVSARLKALMERFRVANSSFEMMEVHGVPDGSYYWMAVNYSGVDEIDFRGSLFQELLNYRVREDALLSFDSFDDYSEWMRESLHTNPEDIRVAVPFRLTWKAGRHHSADVFMLRPFAKEVFVSQELCDAIVGEGISGCTIKRVFEGAVGAAPVNPL